MRLDGLFSGGISRVRSLFADPVENAFQSLSSLFEREFGNLAKHGETPVTNSLLSLFGDVIWADGRMVEKEVAAVKKFLSSHYNQEQVEKFLARLKAHPSANIERDAAPLLHLPESERQRILEALCEVAIASGDIATAARKMLSSICKELQLPPETVANAELACTDKKEQQVRLIRSGAGLLVALMIIGVFILAATFLKSVLFGLILAYFFLPLEKWYEKQVFSRPIVLRFLDFFAKFPAVFRKKEPAETKAQINPALSVCRKNVARSCAATYLTVFLGLSIIATTGVWLSVDFFGGAAKSLREWATPAVPKSSLAIPGEAQAQKPQQSGESLKGIVSNSIAKLETLRPQLDRFPGFTWASSEISKYLSEDQAREDLRDALVQQSGGLWAFISKSTSKLLSLLLGLLLSIFFFVFFLHQMALFSAERLGDKTSPVEYIVNGVFSSGWLPHADAEARRDARDILENILLRLRTWVRGYLSIIIVEVILYTMAFLVIGVPHAVILGLVAGCAVLLPFVGLFASMALTVLFCLTAGSDGGMLTAAVALCAYAFINGILEQFILYPKLIGAALGLNTLETVIIVLLGGCIGGLSGMILAVPAASVLKYLIPQIYRCWKPRQDSPEAKSK